MARGKGASNRNKEGADAGRSYTEQCRTGSRRGRLEIWILVNDYILKAE